jgi:hypothetical protein
MPVVLYECETWFVTLGNIRVLLRIFGSTREAVTMGGRCMELHKEEHLKEDEMGRACSARERDEQFTQDFGQKK